MAAKELQFGKFTLGGLCLFSFLSLSSTCPFSSTPSSCLALYIFVLSIPPALYIFAPSISVVLSISPLCTPVELKCLRVPRHPSPPHLLLYHTPLYHTPSFSFSIQPTNQPTYQTMKESARSEDVNKMERSYLEPGFQ